MNFPTMTTAALAAVVILAPAPAAAQTLGRSGSWTIERNTSTAGQSMCNMYADVSNGGWLYIKQMAGDDHIIMQLFKMSWRLPSWENRVALPITIGVDSNTLLNKDADGYSRKAKPQPLNLVEVTIPGDEVKEFFGEFREALKLWVKFNQGTEQPWVIDMTGSRDAEFVFRSCVKSNMPSTQPYSSRSPTQPYGTQPFGKGGV